jgi:hypothetical protein
MRSCALSVERTVARTSGSGVGGGGLRLSGWLLVSVRSLSQCWLALVSRPGKATFGGCGRVRVVGLRACALTGTHNLARKPKLKVAGLLANSVALGVSGLAGQKRAQLQVRMEFKY